MSTTGFAGVANAAEWVRHKYRIKASFHFPLPRSIVPGALSLIRPSHPRQSRCRPTITKRPGPLSRDLCVRMPAHDLSHPCIRRGSQWVPSHTLFLNSVINSRSSVRRPIATGADPENVYQSPLNFDGPSGLASSGKSLSISYPRPAVFSTTAMDLRRSRLLLVMRLSRTMERPTRCSRCTSTRPPRRPSRARPRRSMPTSSTLRMRAVSARHRRDVRCG